MYIFLVPGVLHPVSKKPGVLHPFSYNPAQVIDNRFYILK